MYFIETSSAWSYAYSDDDETRIESGHVKMAVNGGGTFTFTVSADHTIANDKNFNKLRRTLIIVYYGKTRTLALNADPIFAGVPVSCETDFYGNKTYECHDAFMFFSETIQPNALYTSSNTPDSTVEYQRILDIHNFNQTATSCYVNTTIAKSSTDYEDVVYLSTSGGKTTKDALQAFIDENGGFFIMKYNKKNEDYPFSLYWYADDDYARDLTESAPITLGKNILDLNQEVCSASLYNAVAPLTVTGGFGTEYYSPTIGSGKNEQQIKYGLANVYMNIKEGTEKYSWLDDNYEVGRIVRRDMPSEKLTGSYQPIYYLKPSTKNPYSGKINGYPIKIKVLNFKNIDVSDITDIQTADKQIYVRAKRKLKRLLKRSAEKSVITASVVDLSMVDSSYTEMRVGDKVTLTYNPPTGTQISATKIITEMDFDLCDPTNNTISFGDSGSATISGSLSGYDGISNSVVNYIEDSTTDSVSTTEESIPTVDSALSSTSENPVQNKVITQALSEIPKFSILVVDALPTTDISTTTVYLLRNTEETGTDLYDEYIYVNSKWELLGRQQMSLDGYLQSDSLKRYEGLTKAEYEALEILEPNTDYVISDDGEYTSLAAVATTGEYSDLQNIPSSFTPSAHTHTKAEITDFPTLANVATSGKYSDLSGTPTKLSDFEDDVVSGAYLPLTGGTLTDDLTIDDGAGGNVSLTVSQTSTEDGVTTVEEAHLNTDYLYFNERITQEDTSYVRTQNYLYPDRFWQRKITKAETGSASISQNWTWYLPKGVDTHKIYTGYLLSNLSFRTTAQATYDAEDEKMPNAMYFCVDTNRIYVTDSDGKGTKCHDEKSSIVLTQAQFDALTTLEKNRTYIITDTKEWEVI